MAIGDFVSNLVSGSASGMSMDFGGAGLALSAVGMIGSMITGQQEAGIQSQIAEESSQVFGLEEQVNTQRQMQMQLNAQRSQMQNLRNFQRARAQGLTEATSSGAQFGSGLQGAYGSQSGQANTNTLNTAQNLGIGNTIFGLTGQEDVLKQQMAQQQGQVANLQGTQAIFGGISGLGQGMFSGATSFGKLFGQS